MKTISASDLKERMIDLLKDGWENLDYVKCLVFTWVEMFEPEEDEINNMMDGIFTGSMLEEDSRVELYAELNSMLV